MTEMNPYVSLSIGMAKKRGKYGGIQTQTTDGYQFPSKLEAAVYEILKLREKQGELSDIRCQVRVKMTRSEIAYIADFQAIEVISGKKVYVEAKGFETAIWRIKRRLWMQYGPGRLTIYKGHYKSPFISEVIVPDTRIGFCPECGHEVPEIKW